MLRAFSGRETEYERERSTVCVCVCVCERERVRWREEEIGIFCQLFDCVTTLVPISQQPCVYVNKEPEEQWARKNEEMFH